MTGIYKSREKTIVLHRRQNGRCAICKDGLSLRGEGLLTPTLDHIVPKSRGGTGELANLRLAHKGCNEARGNEIESVSVVVPGGYRVLRAGLA